MDITTLRIAATLVSFATFIGIIYWAFSRRNQAALTKRPAFPFEQD